jgi:ribosomal protein S18 acetylase RimI-like enzyme
LTEKPQGKGSPTLGEKFLTVLRRYKYVYWSKYQLCEHDLTLLPAMDSAAATRLLQRGEEALLPDVGPLPLADVRERLQQGDSCYVGLVDGRLAGYLWIKTQGQHNLMVTDRMLAIQPRECWLYTAWVAEWARGRKLYRAMLVHALHDLAKQGYDRIWAEVALKNAAGRRPLQQTGWKLNHQFLTVGWGPHVALPGFDMAFRKRPSRPLTD